MHQLIIFIIIICIYHYLTNDYLGTLHGFDQFMNLVLGDTIEEVPGSTTGNIICIWIIIIIIIIINR